MLSLIIIFNFALPAFLDDIRFIPFGAVFLFPFIAFTAYAILKHKLFNVRVASSAVLVFALSVVTFSEVIVAHEIALVIYRSVVFLLVLVFGTILIKGVLREVKQREQLQVLTKELEAANEKLKTLDQARAEFISIASHQLRTPPATIKWYLGALQSGDYGEVSKEVKEIIQKAEVTNNSQIALIDDMLNASRIERGTMEFLFEETDIEPLAQLTVDQLVPQAMIKKLALVYHKPKQPLPKVMADKEKLRQVMNNFIDNAIKYTKEGGVSVDLFKKGEDLLFQVTDTGKGITPGEEGSIFEKYSRGKGSINQAQGLGLGLYVAKIIIAQHKGKIWAESAGDGKGSRFIFSIPLHSGVKTTTLLDLAEKK
jgi:signal transduction histidine kinase